MRLASLVSSLVAVDDGSLEPSKDFKGRYYFEKLDMSPVDTTKHRHLNQVYMEGLVWCLAYYYRGCISWSWFYPYHYGMMISDLVDLDSIFQGMRFDPGAPFLPFEQLMGCLPPLSSDLVPRPYAKLMLSMGSPIHDFYPVDFQVDMNGKRNPWEGEKNVIISYHIIIVTMVSVASLPRSRKCV